jgi:HEAT repeat protein
MPQLVIEGGHGRVYDHTISIPSVRNTRALGLPNACSSCHLAESTNWEVPHFERWYPGAAERNHRVALAAAVSGGRGGRPEAQPLLEELLRDGNPVYRAGAARLLARYATDLRPLLGDPHPMVRRAAIDGVARRHPEALLPLLDDENGVLRYRAAMALAESKDQRARQEIRSKLLPLLESFAERRTDNDALHAALARLFELESRPEDAQKHHARATRLVVTTDR